MPSTERPPASTRPFRLATAARSSAAMASDRPPTRPPRVSPPRCRDAANGPGGVTFPIPSGERPRRPRSCPGTSRGSRAAGSPADLAVERTPRGVGPREPTGTERKECVIVSDGDATGTRAGRIVSMDQFRGYTVAGMCVVNFLGGLQAIHPVLKHNNNYFSYADTIMPSFLFACGFSYRLTALGRLRRFGPAATYRRFAWRSIGLILVSLMIYGFGTEFRSYAEMTPENLHG